MNLLDAPVGAAYHLVTTLDTTLQPIAGPLSTALAIVLFTAAVRLLLLPLARSQARAGRARARLQPRVAEIRRRRARNPRRQQKEIADLYAAEGVSPAAGCLPALAQWPFFLVMYRLFVSATVAGHPNVLLAKSLLTAPLGEHLSGVIAVYGAFAPPALVVYGVIALIAAVGWWSSRRMRQDSVPGWLRLMPYGTVLVAGFVPLAAALYLLTTTAWTAAERAVLHRGTAPAA